MTSEDKLRNEEPDPELMALAGTGTRPSILRPILMIAVIIMGGWIISDWRTELEYFASSSEPVELGDAIDYASLEDFTSKLPHNRYVSLRGIPTQRSQASRYRFFRLIGAPVFVEKKRDDIIEDPLERELNGDAKGDVDRTMFNGAGRLVKFSEMQERYGGLRHYYHTRYNLTFCEDLTPQAFDQIKNRKRDAIIATLEQEYQEATPEERELKRLTEKPAPELVEQLLADDPICVDMWLLQDDVKPKDHAWYVLATLLFAGFMFFNLVMLIRWIRAFIRS